jgi:hypothetical protein
MGTAGIAGYGTFDLRKGTVGTMVIDGKTLHVSPSMGTGEASP